MPGARRHRLRPAFHGVHRYFSLLMPRPAASLHDPRSRQQACLPDRCFDRCTGTVGPKSDRAVEADPGLPDCRDRIDDQSYRSPKIRWRGYPLSDHLPDDALSSLQSRMPAALHRQTESCAKLRNTQPKAACLVTYAEIQGRLRLRRPDHHGPHISRKSFRRSEEHTSELQSLTNLVCRLLLEKKKNI